MFESHNEWWDILCDVDTGSIKLPTPKQVNVFAAAPAAALNHSDFVMLLPRSAES